MSTNVSKQKREDLLFKIKELRKFISSASQDENTGNLLTYLSELEKDVNGKKYGLVFEEHREEIDDVLCTHTPVLTENKEFFFNNGGNVNFLIEGDNLAALKLLEKTYKGRIDLIYIDPPYNTKNKDFIYDDVFVDKTDTFAHSKWLSFMEKRLRCANKLLSVNGAIFISIDDNEESALKLLCDSIFSEDCFVSNVSWQRTYSMRNDSKGIPSEVEHILIYSKKPDWIPKRLPRTEKMDANYKNPDNDLKGDWQNTSAFAPGASTHQGMVYAIQHPFTGKMIYPTQNACWRYKQSDMLAIMCGWCKYELRDLNDAKERAKVCGIAANEIRCDVKGIVLSESLDISCSKAQEVYDRGQWPRFFFTSNGKGGIRRKTYKENLPGKTATNLWLYSDTGHTDEAKKEIISIFEGNAPFDTPKPTRLIERILDIASTPDATVLDFFAGSGTTGHAVLKYNAEHTEGNRKFILCTNNENNICRDVTYERIKRVIDKENYSASLKYYKIDYVPIDKRMYYEYANELLLHIRELVELENGIDFTNNVEIAIILTEDELSEFVGNVNAFSKCRKIYMGHDLLPTEEQINAIEKNDISISIIPDYYYKDLQEG